MNDAKTTLQAPPWRERIAAALTLLTVVVSPLAIIVGVVEYLWLRRRKVFIAYHGLQAAVWQVLTNLAVLPILIYTRVAGLTPLQWQQLGEDYFPVILTSPFYFFRAMWPDMDPLLRRILIMMVSIVVVNLLVAAFGVITTLRGKYFRVPLIGWLFGKNIRPVK
ncbi:MAG: hypothetical protein ACYDBB_13460 [Armatimonadota bacterium]